jgi:hypothetical protein
MKKLWIIIAIAVICFLSSCPEPTRNNPNNIPDDPDAPDNPNQKTTIVFDNTQGICAVSVYDYYSRGEEDKIADVLPGQSSGEIEWTPGDSVPFYFSYSVNLKGISSFTLNYVPEIGKDHKAVRIDANKKTVITIPKLDETLSSPDTLLSDKSYLLIQNNSSFSFQLLRGSVILQPDKASATLVNSGEKAQYTINPGGTSQYQLLVGADYKAFSGSITSFESGRVYSFIFDGDVSLFAEIELILENVAGIPQHTTGPETPGTPLVTASDGLLTLRWTAVQGAEEYEIYYSTSLQPPAAPERTVSGTAVVLTGLSNKTAYYVWIKAVNNSGSSDFSPRVRGIPWPNYEAPAMPERPVIIPGINQLTVNWDECGGASSYEVYINTAATNPSMPEVTTDKTSAVIKNLQNDIIYYVWVRSVNSAGKSGYSPLEAGTPKIPTIAPAIPAKPVVTAGNHELTVSWQAVELAAAYEVWFGKTDNSGQAQQKSGDIAGDITETIITGLENEIVYYVWIRAKNVVGTSGFSPSANAKTSAFAVLPATPAAPTINPGSGSLNVSWQTVEGTLSYEVWTSVSNNTATAQKYGADVSGTSLTLSGLNNETTYYIWIKAKNNIGTSNFSSVAYGTPSAFAATPPAPQTAPTIIAGNTQLTVSWQTAEGASSYEIWAGTSNNSAMATKRGGDVSGLSTVISGLTNGTTYYVWIKAKNSIGTSGFGPAASGIPSSFTVTPQAPALPSVSTGNGQLTVAWAAVEGAMSYEVWAGTTNNSASSAKNGADVTTSLSATINGLTNGTTYYVWVKAKNNIGTSGFSPAASGKPIANASAPTLSAGNGQFVVNWSVIAGADQYEVFCGTGINPPQTASQTVTATTATVSGLTNGTTYNVWVRGKNSTGTGAMSSAVSGRPIGNMGTVTPVSGNGQITVSWSAVAGADQYEVYYNTSNSMPSSPSQTVTTTTATISSLSNGTTYYVWIKPVNANGAGNANTAVSGTPMATPGALTISAGNQQITVSWAAVPGANSYEVYYSTTTTIPALPTDTVTGLNKTITGLSNGINYNFWVKAVNTNGTSGASPMASGKPIGNMGTVTLTTGGSGQLILNWSAVAGADQYEVYYNTSNSMPSSPSQTVTTTTATISSLSNGTTYYVWVMPKNASGESNTSTVVSGKPVGTPGTPILSPGHKQLTVSWTSVAGADEYEVFYGTSTPTTLATTTTGITATITGLTNDITYYVRLRAKNSTGVSNYGTTEAAIPTMVGLYRGAIDNSHKIGGQNLSDSLTYISANAITGDDFYIVLGANESISPTILNYSGKTVGITLVGSGSERTVTLNANGQIFTINSGVTLTLDENITLMGYSTNNNRLVDVLDYHDGKLIMKNGAKISGNGGPGVYIGQGGTFTMEGGEISGNASSGVKVSAGTFTMNGGKISGNTSYDGGGVSISGTFTMNNGEISDNTADSYGGGGVSISGTFTMNGGKISGNTCNFGGGVDIKSGTFTMYGGKISGNTGGGVNISSGSLLTMYGGVISGNSNRYGGGVMVGGTFKKLSLTGEQNSGIIYGSEAVGVDEGGIPLKNTATSNGDVVYFGSRLRNTTASETDHIDTTTGKGLSTSGNPPFGQ